jgi:hypothetical protein
MAYIAQEIDIKQVLEVSPRVLAENDFKLRLLQYLLQADGNVE